MRIWNGKEWEDQSEEQTQLTNARNKIGTKLETKADIDLINKNSNAHIEENLKKPDTFQTRLEKAGSTVGDLFTNVGKGLFYGTESLVDLGRYGVAGVADMLGAKEYANDVRERAKQDTTSIIFKPADDFFNPKSMLKENGIAENVAQGVGQVGAIVGSGALLPGKLATVKIGKFNLPTTSILSGAGSGMTEAYNNGASNEQAVAYGALSGLVEGFSESLFGGLGKTFSSKFGGGALDDVLVKKLTDKISSKTFKTLTEVGIKAAGEGVEEVLSGLGSAMAKKLTYMDKEDIIKLINDEDLLNSFVVGALTSAVAQSPSSYQIIKNNKLSTNVKNTLENLPTNSVKTQNNINIPTAQNIVQNELNLPSNTGLNIDTNLNTNINVDETIDPLKNLQEYKQQQQEIKNIKMQQEQNENINNRIDSLEKQLEKQGTRILEESESQKQAMIEHFKEYLEENNITNPTQQDINDSITDNLIYDNELGMADTVKAEQLYNQYVKEYMQENGIPFNDTKTLKNQQLDIIQKINPMKDDYHTGIRNADDIKTFEEAINDDESFTWGDYTKEDAIRDLQKGTVTVYSSYPIENGNFVSTSKNQARDYAGGNNAKIYSKEVPLTDVAWINGDEGQYAKVQPNIPTARNIQQDVTIPTYKQGNIPIDSNLFNKYNNVNEIFENEKTNYDGVVNVKNIDIDLNGKNATAIYHDAVEIFNTNHNTNHFKNDGNDIYVTNQDIKESINKIYNDRLQNRYLKEHLEVFSDLGDIIENAKLVNQTAENKNRTKYNTWNYYYSGLKINGELYNLEFDVVSRQDGENHYRLQRLKKADTQSALPIKGEADFGAPASINNDSINLPKSQISLPTEYNMQQNKKVIPKNPTKESSYDDFKETKKTRKEVQQELQDEMGITIDDISAGKDISSIAYQRTDPIRLNEKVFGAEIGKKINDATINKTKHNEAERIRFLNQERDEIKNLGIKPRSKESAAVQKYGEKQYINDKGDVLNYGDKELMAEFSDEKTREKIKKAAETLRNKYDKYIDNINEVITEMGYDPIPKRKDYMRHFQELNDKFTEWGLPINRQSLNENNIPTDINGLTDQFKPGKNWFASAMQRKGLKTTYDAITGIDGYLEGASNLMYHTEDIQRYRALSKLVRDTFGQTHGLDNVDLSTEEGQKRLNDIYDNKLSKYAAWLDEQANALAGKKGAIDRGAERVLGRRIYSVLDAAKKQVGSNMTGFNVRSALTNFASAVQGASKTNKLAFIKGTLSTVKNIVHNDGLINKSDFLTSRFGSDQLSKKLWQKASNAGQILMSGSDYFTANQIWRSKYYENLSKGMSESQAIKNADDFAARIMGDRSKGATAEIFNSKTLGLLTQFQLEVNNQWSSMIHDNKMDIKNGNKTGATVLFQLGQLAAMSYLFNNFMKSMTGSDVMIDPIDMLKKIFGSDDDDKSLEERAQEVLGDVVNDLPFASFLTGGRIPVAEAFTGASTAFKKITGQKDKYGNDITWSDVKDDAISSAFYWLLPTGYGQAKKTTQGLSMYDGRLPMPGSYTNSGNLRFRADESTSGKVKAALFGQYSSKEAQEYRESGYKAISKARLDEVKDLNMTASEYRKYREKLNEAGTKNADKIDFIANSNYTDKQKNIMAKNVLERVFDINEYKKYDSYDEYDYATKNPDKYSVIKQITSYDKYNTYKDKLTDIRNNTTNDKTETIKYINSLPLSIPQKAIFIKQYYKSYTKYDKEIVDYVKQNCKTQKEREQVLSTLGFTIKDGRVYY